MGSEVNANMVGKYYINAENGEVVELLHWRRANLPYSGTIWHVEDWKTRERYDLSAGNLGRPVPPLEIIARAAQE